MPHPCELCYRKERCTAVDITRCPDKEAFLAAKALAYAGQPRLHQWSEQSPQVSPESNKSKKRKKRSNYNPW